MHITYNTIQYNIIQYNIHYNTTYNIILHTIQYTIQNSTIYNIIQYTVKYKIYNTCTNWFQAQVQLKDMLADIDQYRTDSLDYIDYGSVLIFNIIN